MTSPKEQKHHFIPRFILRKFAPADQPPAWPAASSKRKPRGRDFLVNKIDVESSILTQRPVSTEFALVDMYRDPGFDENPYHLEEKLSRLESKASDIINKAAETFARTPVLSLKRPEVDTLRKFLFLMKYRNGGMFERYNHDDAQDYDSDDRPRMLRYMDAKGFSKPRDVWFDNLRHMLDLEMDPHRNWRGTLREQIYPDDALMFEFHLLHSYMAFCQPANGDEEFLLTENAFGVFEGPSSERHDILAGKKQAVVYTEYHNFAPLAPRLIIILRSGILPYPGDSGNYTEIRQLFAAAVKSAHIHPDQAGSVLEDLPVRPCKKIYHSPRIDSPASFNANDEFKFLCFKLSTAHISTINNIFLEEAYQTSSIVYHSRTALQAAIERYFVDDRPGLKQVIDIPEDRRRLYLRTLEQILRTLGDSTTCKIKSFNFADARVRIHMALNVGRLVGVQILRSQQPPGSLPREYILLKPGSSVEEFRYDLDQASRLVMLKAKLDGALNKSGLSEAERSTVRVQVHEFLMSFPVERLWFFFKILRNLRHCDMDDIWTRMPDLELDGPEDAFIEHTIAHFPPGTKDILGRALYMTMMGL
ncbi:hypothetical protein BJX68DRAFT_259011 [Aspergillus pseudodeflectus]|uniref:DUF4238 domain-containing protein n=1 Tax=Aspergillus pseudodeflectus TaxID=176178 RepID=A0ABR4JGC8_9EURO